MNTKHRDFIDGARDSVPILLGVIPFAMICSVAAVSVGLTPFEVEPGTAFDTKQHQVSDGVEAPEGAQIAAIAALAFLAGLDIHAARNPPAMSAKGAIIPASHWGPGAFESYERTELSPIE